MNSVGRLDVILNLENEVVRVEGELPSYMSCHDPIAKAFTDFEEFAPMDVSVLCRVRCSDCASSMLLDSYSIQSSDTLSHLIFQIGRLGRIDSILKIFVSLEAKGNFSQ